MSRLSNPRISLPPRSANERVTAGQLLLVDESSLGRCRISPDAVREREGAIAEVIEGEVPAHLDLGGPDCLIAPGFIDTHLHLPQFDMIGAHGMPLLDWLAQVTYPAEQQWHDVDAARPRTASRDRPPSPT